MEKSKTRAKAPWGIGCARFGHLRTFCVQTANVAVLSAVQADLDRGLGAFATRF